MDNDWNAREVLILDMLAGYHSTVANPTIDAMVKVAMPYQLEAVRQACERYATGEVDGHDRRFPPTAPELASQIRFMDGVLSGIARRNPDGLISYRIGEPPPDGTVPLGPLSVDFGSGPIDLRGMTHEQKEEVLRNKGLPQIAGSPVQPKLQGME